MNHLSEINLCTSLLIRAFITYPSKIDFAFFLFDFEFRCEVSFRQLAQSFRSIIKFYILKIVTHSNTCFRNIKGRKHSCFLLYFL